MKKHLIKWFYISLLPVGIVIQRLAAAFPEWVETYYSLWLYPLFSQALSRASGIFPFSLAELFFFIFACTLLLFISRLLFAIYRKELSYLSLLKKASFVVWSTLGILYSLFLLLWGLNYHRKPVHHIFQLPPVPAQASILDKLHLSLILQANSLRDLLPEDVSGVMSPKNGISGVLSRATSGFYHLGKSYPAFSRTYGRPKPVFFSVPLSYTQIWGIYTFITFEANLNTEVPSPFLPVTTLHEVAHQHGFAREDEANFIAYMACKSHPDRDFQYSGFLLAISHVSNKLYAADPILYKKGLAAYSSKVLRDLHTLDTFDKRYRGRLSEISSQANDIYLKSNHQREGKQSYGRVVDLLIAEFEKARQGASKM